MTDSEPKEITKRTESCINWACRVFEDWRNYHNERIKKGNTDCQSSSRIDRPLEELDDNELNYCLSRFICEIRKENGNEYPPKTLKQLILLLQNHIGRHGRRVKLLFDAVFSELQNTLGSVMKEKSNRGVGLNTRQAQVISFQQEMKLWELSILGTSNPESLVNTLLYLIGLNFALRSSDEHKNLTVDQFYLGTNEMGSFLKYTQEAKTGAKDGNVPTKSAIAYAHDQEDRCIVAIFKKYMSLRPRNASAPDGMYLRPLAKPLEHQWYSTQLIGKHTLSRTIGRMCEKAGFQGFFTNHSLRATCTARMFQANVDEQLIAQTTGHRSKAIRRYKQAGTSQEEHRPQT